MTINSVNKNVRNLQPLKILHHAGLKWQIYVGYYIIDKKNVGEGDTNTIRRFDRVGVAYETTRVHFERHKTSYFLLGTIIIISMYKEGKTSM